MSGNEYSIIYSQEAINDIDSIYAYIAFQLLEPNTAKNQVNRIRNTIHSLTFMPLRNQTVDFEPWKSAGIRRLLINRFVVFYFVDATAITVNIVRVVYGGKNIGNIIKSDTQKLDV